MNDRLQADTAGLRADRYDVDGIKSWMFPICGPHRLRAQRPADLCFRYQGALFKSMSTSIGLVEFGSDVVANVEGGEASRLMSYNISLPLSGVQYLQKDGAQIHSDADSGIVVSPHEVQEVGISGNCRKIMVSITPHAMNKVLSDMIERAPDDQIVFDGAVSAVQGNTASWWRMIKFFLAEVETSQTLHGNALLSRDLENALIKGLLLAQPNNYSAELAEAGNPRIPHYVLRAKDFMQRHAGDDIALEDIEAAAGVSRDKLFEVFKKHCGLSPMGYLKKFRLEEFRRQLLEDRSNANISSIAMSCGFNHLGRFSADYRKLFEETPSQTLKRLRDRHDRSH